MCNSICECLLFAAVSVCCPSSTRKCIFFFYMQIPYKKKYLFLQRQSFPILSKNDWHVACNHLSTSWWRGLVSLVRYRGWPFSGFSDIFILHTSTCHTRLGLHTHTHSLSHSHKHALALTHYITSHHTTAHRTSHNIISYHHTTPQSHHTTSTTHYHTHHHIHTHYHTHSHFSWPKFNEWKRTIPNCGK